MNRPLFILLVDDDEDDKEMFCEVVKEINSSSTCMTAASGIQALQILEKQEIIPDIIFLDLNMPKMNGKQCLIKIKNIERFSTVPVIIYSTAKVEEEIIETKRLGAEGFMVKPSSTRQLKKELEITLEKKLKYLVSK